MAILQRNKRKTLHIKSGIYEYSVQGAGVAFPAAPYIKYQFAATLYQEKKHNCNTYEIIYFENFYEIIQLH